MRALKLFRQITITLPLIALLAACQKKETEDISPDRELTLRFDDLDFIIDPTAGSGPLDLTLDFDAQTSIADLLQQNGYTLDNLKEVHLQEARVVIVEPANTPFDALESMRLDLVLPVGAPLTAAHKDQVPDGLGILNLTVYNTNLTTFFQTDAGVLHARIETSSPIAQETRLRFALTFRVKAGS